uniref:Uncharacterized protein n=1 Tax=Arundo donax TaxID=35708 RepID=A0A0A9GQX0_ARUDO
MLYLQNIFYFLLLPLTCCSVLFYCIIYVALHLGYSKAVNFSWLCQIKNEGL